MKKITSINSAGLLFVLLLPITFIAIPLDVAAKAKVVVIEGMHYDADASIEDNLKSLTGKSVSVTVASGKTLTGTIKSVGNHLLHLEKLGGKEFYDALIRIEDISAIEARFRHVKRD